MKRLFKNLLKIFIGETLETKKEETLLKLQEKLATAKKTTDRARINAYIGLLHCVNKDTLKLINDKIDDL